MKRYRIKNKFRFISFVTVLILAVVFTATSVLGYARAAGSDDHEYVTIQVQSGDTLWELAKEYGPKDQDVRKTVFEICKLNNIQASELRAGDFIKIQTN